MAGLGLKVVAPSPARSAGAGVNAEAGAAVSQREAEGDRAEQYQNVDEGEAGEDMGGAAGRLGGWFDDGQNTSRRERTRAIRKEEKEGKSPEKVCVCSFGVRTCLVQHSQGGGQGMVVWHRKVSTGPTVIVSGVFCWRFVCMPLAEADFCGHPGCRLSAAERARQGCRGRI